jgi:hypothetical protein
MVPLYVTGKALAHHLSLPYDITTLYSSRSLDLFLGALLAIIFYLMARSVGFSARVGAVLTLIFALATPAWPDAQSALEQTQVDLFLLVAVYALWRFQLSGLRRRRWLVGAGTAMGAAIFTRYDAAIYLPILIGYLTVLRARSHMWRDLVLDSFDLGLSIAPWILAVGAWNVLRYGEPWATGLHERTFGEPFFSGLFGLTVSPGKGLLWYLPLVWLLPWAGHRFYRQQPGLATLCAVLIATPLVFYSTVLYWHGDPAWGPRYLYTALPYLILPLGSLLQSWRQRAAAMKGALIALVCLSLVIQVSAVSMTQWRFWYRIEAAEEHTAHPFRWGAQYYHYYWNVGQSPILLQIDNVYQVLRLQALGDQGYRLTTRPAHLASNPANNYPINTVSFWWADTRHPLLGSRTRYTIAAGLGGLGLVAFIGLVVAVLRETTSRPRPVHGLELAAAEPNR